MRLSGLAAGIATFAVLEITHNVLRYWDRIGPAQTTLSLVPETTDALQATLGAVIAIAAGWAYAHTRRGRLLRATREDAAAAQAVGANVHRERLVAFTLSGALAGFAGGLFVHMLGSITTEQVYLELTFITLAMLVIGGAASLWGAVLGALVVSALDSFLGEAEDGVELGVAPRPAAGHAADLPGRDHGARAHRASLGPHGRAGVRAPAPAPPPARAAPPTRRRAGPREGLHRRLRGRRARCSPPTWRSSTTWRSGRTTSRREHVERDQRARPAALGRGRGGRAPARHRPTPPSCRPATSASWPPRPCTPSRRSRPRRTRSRAGSVATVQNGLGNEEAHRGARRARDPRHDLPGRAAGRARPRAVGRARATRRSGPFEGRPAPFAEVERLADACTRAGMPTHAVADARGPQWRKVIFNASTNPIGALTGLTHGRVCERPDLRALVSGLVDEGKAVAAAQGIELDADPEELIDYAARPEVAYDHKASMLQDVQARRQTEIDYLNGGIGRFGARARRADAAQRRHHGAGERSRGLVGAARRVSATGAERSRRGQAIARCRRRRSSGASRACARPWRGTASTR